MTELPHQLWTANSSLINFVIDGLKAHYKKSRLIAEMIFISFDNSGLIKFKENIDYEVKKTIDDEYTPSVFEVSPCSQLILQIFCMFNFGADMFVNCFV